MKKPPGQGGFSFSTRMRLSLRAGIVLRQRPRTHFEGGALVKLGMFRSVCSHLFCEVLEGKLIGQPETGFLIHVVAKAPHDHGRSLVDRRINACNETGEELVAGGARNAILRPFTRAERHGAG